MAKFARYGPAPKYDLPEAGFCLSSFALLRRDDEVLLGRPQDHPRWEAEWAPNFSVYEEEDRAAEFRSWRFPAAYLYEGEHPRAALDRVLRDQLQVDTYEVHPGEIFAFYDPSDWFPGKRHYDLCFVYEVRAEPPSRPPEWFQELQFVEAGAVGRGAFGSAMGDLAVALGLSHD